MTPRRQRLTREESKARTRSELLRAASRLFVRNGFVATSLSDIAEEAALTKGAVYSNFDSKEELFLALLQEISRPSNEWAHQQETAPSDLSAAVGDTPEERAENWGRAVAALAPSRRNVALFLEMNAVALRSDRARAWVTEHNREFFVSLGEQIRDALEVPDADAELLGTVAQSIYVGLMTHSAFNSTPADPEVYGAAYRLLAELARLSADAARPATGGRSR
jgi:AcrR family transcriptional regulator